MQHVGLPQTKRVCRISPTGSAHAVAALLHATPVAAKLYFFPHALPFFPPREGATTDGAQFLRKVGLLYAFHEGQEVWDRVFPTANHKG